MPPTCSMSRNSTNATEHNGSMMIQQSSTTSSSSSNKQGTIPSRQHLDEKQSHTQKPRRKQSSEPGRKPSSSQRSSDPRDPNRSSRGPNSRTVSPNPSSNRRKSAENDTTRAAQERTLTHLQKSTGKKKQTLDVSMHTYFPEAQGEESNGDRQPQRRSGSGQQESHRPRPPVSHIGGGTDEVSRGESKHRRPQESHQQQRPKQARSPNRSGDGRTPGTSVVKRPENDEREKRQRDHQRRTSADVAAKSNDSSRSGRSQVARSSGESQSRRSASQPRVSEQKQQRQSTSHGHSPPRKAESISSSGSRPSGGTPSSHRRVPSSGGRSSRPTEQSSRSRDAPNHRSSGDLDYAADDDRRARGGQLGALKKTSAQRSQRSLDATGDRSRSNNNSMNGRRRKPSDLDQHRRTKSNDDLVAYEASASDRLRRKASDLEDQRYRRKPSDGSDERRRSGESESQRERPRRRGSVGGSVQQQPPPQHERPRRRGSISNGSTPQQQYEQHERPRRRGSNSGESADHQPARRRGSNSGETADRPRRRGSNSGETADRPRRRGSNSGETTDRPRRRGSNSGDTLDRQRRGDGGGGIVSSDRPRRRNSIGGGSSEYHKSAQSRPRRSQNRSNGDLAVDNVFENGTNGSNPFADAMKAILLDGQVNSGFNTEKEMEQRIADLVWGKLQNAKGMQAMANESQDMPTGDPTAGPPQNTATIVLTDVQGSTSLWEENAQAMQEALDIHDKILRRFCAFHNGYEIDTEGDAFFLAFHSPMDAFGFALDTQSALYDTEWSKDILATKAANEEGCFRGLRVRMGIHQGPVISCTNEVTGRTEYIGEAMAIAKCVEGMTHGGQILTTFETWNVASYKAEADLGSPQVVDMGCHLLNPKGSDDPVARRIIQLVPASLSYDYFAARRTIQDDNGSAPSVPPKGRQFDAPITDEQVSAAFLDAPYKNNEATIAFVYFSEIETKYEDSKSIVAALIRLIGDLLTGSPGYHSQSNMLAFPDVNEAVKFGLRLMEELKETKLTDDYADLSKLIKFGCVHDTFLTMGPHKTTGRADYFGKVVNRAARITAKSELGTVNFGVLADVKVTKLPKLDRSIISELKGVKQLKGVQEEMVLYRCTLDSRPLGLQRGRVVPY